MFYALCLNQLIINMNDTLNSSKSHKLINGVFDISQMSFISLQPKWLVLTLKAPITTAANNQYCDIFHNFRNNKVYFMRIICWQTILMKYRALFVIFEKAAKFEGVVCCKL